MTQAEKFAKLNGIEWHIHKYKRKLPNWICSCGKENCGGSNPTFTDAKSILEVMMKRKDWTNFSYKIGYCGERTGYNYIDIDYILNPDKLLDEAIKWCEVQRLRLRRFVKR